MFMTLKIYFMIIPTIVILILLFLIILGFILHSSIFGRTKKLIETEDDVKGRYLEPYFKDINQGMKWMKSQNKEEILIKSFDGINLAGRLIDNHSDVCIICCHGYHSYGEFDFSCIGEYYYKKGYKILIIDERAHGKSEGRFSTFGILESKDLLEWIKYIDKRFTNIKILIDGISMGSSTTLYATGLELPNSVKGVIADCGFTSPFDIVKYTMNRKYHLPHFPILNFVNFASKIRTGIKLNDYKTADALKKCKVPVFFLHGKKDSIVPYEMSIENYNAVNSYKEMYLVENADHGVSYLIEKEVCTKKLQDFIDYCLKY